MLRRYFTLSLIAIAAAHGQRQLFVDDYVIESARNLKRTIHPVRKYEDNPILLPVKPWEGQYALLYGTVIRDEEEGIWKAWYSTMNHFRYIQNIFPESTYLCYATSRDGIHWNKPALGVVDYRGSRENNIVLEGVNDPEHGIFGILDSVSILKDKHDPDPARRYKLMIWRHNQRFQPDGKHAYVLEGRHRMGYYVAFSPDGIHWNERPEPIFTYLPVRDTMATMWDPRTKRYIAYVKEQVDGKRARFVSESDDFLHWSEPVRMLAADSQDAPDDELYASNGFPYEGVYLGLLTVFHPTPNYLDIQLIHSRDARTWHRTGDRTPFIPVGRKNINWDFGFNSPSSAAPIRVGDELWFYYSGRAYRHPIDGKVRREPNKGAIGLAKLRLDGFVSMDAGDAEGVLITKPVEVRDGWLVVNADASRGELRVEVEGREATLRSDQIHWRALKVTGKTAQVKFTLRNASLYSFSL